MAFSAAATFAGLLCPSPLPRDRGTRSDEEKLTFHIPIKMENPEDDEKLFNTVRARSRSSGRTLTPDQRAYFSVFSCAL